MEVGIEAVEPEPKMGCVVRGRAPATCLSYHESGSHLFVASERDSTIRIVDCLRGGPPTDRPAVVKLRREGVRFVRATHHGHCVLFAGGTGALSGGGRAVRGGVGGSRQGAVHYLSVHDNKLVRNFYPGTSSGGGAAAATITAVSMSPLDDTFLSSSSDGTVRLWDIQQPGFVAELRLPQNVEGSPLVAFDYTGLVFGASAKMAGGEGYHLHLYDARNYAVGPFSEMKVSRSDIESKIRASSSTGSSCTPERAYALSRSEWTSLEFDKSGRQILACGRGGLALTIDGYEGSALRAFLAEGGSLDGSGGGGSGSVNSQPPQAACFTSDDRTILCGNENGTVSCADAETGRAARRLKGHVDRVGCVAANPKYAQIATACTNTALWIW